MMCFRAKKSKNSFEEDEYEVYKRQYRENTIRKSASPPPPPLPSPQLQRITQTADRRSQSPVSTTLSTPSQRSPQKQQKSLSDRPNSALKSASRSKLSEKSGRSQANYTPEKPKNLMTRNRHRELQEQSYTILMRYGRPAYDNPLLNCQ
uniref:Uncharacterized protein n=1 Tax=Trichobilharzia regenti TaxID=157069 RepID=A0AA85JT47_TRIRE|nr:unnamed protein product [Trichobilharzia regenti]